MGLVMRPHQRLYGNWNGPLRALTSIKSLGRSALGPVACSQSSYWSVIIVVVVSKLRAELLVIPDVQLLCTPRRSYPFIEEMALASTSTNAEPALDIK